MIDIKALRKALNIRQLDFGKKIGINQNTVSMYENYPNKQPKYIDEKVADAFGKDISEKYIINIEDNITTCENECNSIPVIPIAAQGGSLVEYFGRVNPDDCERIVSPIRGVDFAISVRGDSMAPEYPNGSQVMVKRIDESIFIDWGRAYVIDTKNGAIIKKLMPSRDPDCVKCVSINDDYPEFEIRRENIIGIYRVVICMSVK